MKTTKLFAAVLTLGMMLALTTNVQAQNSADATVQATATLLESLEFNTSSNLVFGEIYYQQSKSIAYDDADAADFEVNGEGGKEISVDFTLPTALDLDGVTDATETIDISFSTTDASYETAENATVAENEFDPSVSQTFTIGSDGNLIIFLGGTIEDTGGAAAGDYEGDITLDVAYTDV